MGLCTALMGFDGTQLEAGWGLSNLESSIYRDMIWPILARYSQSSQSCALTHLEKLVFEMI
jgi:hypothetical protein